MGQLERGRTPLRVHREKEAGEINYESLALGPIEWPQVGARTHLSVAPFPTSINVESCHI